ncbi:MAG: hypothetical protein NNA19_02515 [Nitrospira sp.]|nr:hypothetical protein [Nitrospira sp.]
MRRLSVVMSMAVACAALTLGQGEAEAVIIINYPDFSSVAGLTLNGNAAQVGNVLRVTPAIGGQSGSVFSTTPVTLSSNASFSTYFQFRFTNPGGLCDGQGCGADGLTFTVQTVGNNVGGAGGGIGYAYISPSVAVEFDSWNNGLGDGLSSNHIGIDVNGNMDSVVLAQITEADLNGGDIWHAWVDYDGVAQVLEARLSRSNSRPSAPFLSHTIDLASTLGSPNVFVGFTSGTGGAFADHDVLSWVLDNSYHPINPVPVPAAVYLFGAGLVGLVGLARRRG